MKTNTTEAPDTRPGNYYVSAVDGAIDFATGAPKVYLALGPFPTHAEALAKVDEVKDFYYKHDSTGRAYFMGYGTVRAEHYNRPGNLNKHLNLN